MNIDKNSGPVLVFRDIGRDEPPQPVNGDSEWLNHIRARERAERSAAKNATNEQARRVHQELAQAYVRIIERSERRARTGHPGQIEPGARSVS